MTTLGIIGAGKIGSQLARLAVAHGHDVVISNSRGPETLVDLTGELGSSATAATPAEAAERGDIVVVTIPYQSLDSLPAEQLAGKIVIDTNNYYPGNGPITELDDESTTTSERLQAMIPGARVVKGFNHVFAKDVVNDSQPAGTENRRAVVVASDDDEAKARVAALFDELGYDTVDLGPLSEGWRIQRDTPAYGPRRNAEELRRDLAAAKRYRDMSPEK